MFQRNCNYNPIWRLKRKIEPDVETPPPQKMHITEEKMVNQLRGIHLSQDYTSHGATEASESEVNIVESLKTSYNEMGTIPSLEICDEIRALQNKVDPIVPDCILNRFMKPTTALVLWQPPAGSLGVLQNLSSEAGSSKKKEDTEPVELPGPSQPPPAGPAVDVEMNEEDNNNNNNNLPMFNGFIAGGQGL